MKNKIHEKWQRFWDTLGIRHLGTTPTSINPTALDRSAYDFEHGYSEGQKDGEASGRLHAYEVAVGILYHAYGVHKRHSGKEAEITLMIKNQILEIREAQGQEMEQAGHEEG